MTGTTWEGASLPDAFVGKSVDVAVDWCAGSLPCGNEADTPVELRDESLALCNPPDVVGDRWLGPVVLGSPTFGDD
eukprot:CAMPEP_0118940154 /NCGR_PEP_ID=MMETSP1169-20130426/30731_1 /TAXON_ID=36882 /ORGANISM="Pyramimonas obovata, Strain CCMP722" /LENGTH=75 /DNA_ID=CAMNT_0006884573 /DNA_START=182 /DNA_END=409 /DNA_ORIENTATION=-